MLDKLVTESLSFDFVDSGVVSMLWASEMPWRELPFMVANHVTGSAVTLEVEGEPPQQLEDGQASLICAGTKHRVSKPRRWSSSAWSHINFTVFDTVDLFNLIRVPVVVEGEVAESIGSINRELTALNEDENMPLLARAARTKACGFRLLSVVLDVAYYRADAGQFLGNLSRLAPVLRYLQDNIATPLDRNSLAQMLYLSPSRFNVIFKDTMGMSPTEYVKGMRIRQAQRLLVKTDMRVAEVAVAVGFNDQFNFSRVFKRSCGVSPQQFRRNAQDWTLT